MSAKGYCMQLRSLNPIFWIVRRVNVIDSMLTVHIRWHHYTMIVSYRHYCEQSACYASSQSTSTGLYTAAIILLKILLSCIKIAQAKSDMT